MPVTEITSDHLMTNVEQHFRVSAGPGAGKTHWLSEHIKNVLHNSERLTKSRKIACITFTNIGVETLLKRLGNSAEQVEVTTIHSFLYKHLVKPYISFIADEYGINVSKIDGHDEVFTSPRKIKSWIESHPNVENLRHPFSLNQLLRLPNNKNAISNWLSSVSYKLNNTGTIEIQSKRSEAYYLDEFKARHYLNSRTLNLLETDFLRYKMMYWEQGRLSHDDVLFFSFQLITKHPFLLMVIRNKFPYFFIDEFQDSNPIQVAILKKIGEEETKIGIIGDQMQAIFEFQGADPAQFQSFNIPMMKEYMIQENRRSTKKLIELYNVSRTDISQVEYREESGDNPILLVGTTEKALEKAMTACDVQKVVSLSRTNVTSNAMKIGIDGIGLNPYLFNDLFESDSNSDRKFFITALIKSIELSKQKKFKDAIKTLDKLLKKQFTDKLERKKEALKLISQLMQEYEDFKDKSLYDFYLIVKEKIWTTIPNLINRGAAKPFYENTEYKKIALCVSIPEDISLHKTIHKAKGDEFDNVLLVLKEEADLAFILNPNLANNEEQRINYVAITRAKNRLFINVPTLSEENLVKLQSIGFNVENA